MAKLTIKSLTCHEQEDWTGDDQAYLVVYTPDRRQVWAADMDTGQTRQIGVDVEFQDTVRIQLMEEDWPDGDDDLGSITANASQSAAVDIRGRFTQDDADYTIIYRISGGSQDDGTTTSPTDPVQCEHPDHSTNEGPASGGGAGDASHPCPQGNLIVIVRDENGQPVQGVNVVVIRIQRRGVTGPDGSFDFGLLPEGTYPVEGRKEGYTPDPASREGTVVANSSNVVELTLSTVLFEVRPKTDQKWYVNEPANAAGHHGRDVPVEAEVRPPMAGVRIHFRVEAAAGNRASLPPGMQHRLSALSAVTDARGIARTTLTLSRYGGDRFRVSASLDPAAAAGAAGTKSSGWFEVWRKLVYEVDCMQRTSGGSYSNRNDTAGLNRVMASVFIELRQVGTDNTPAHQRVVTKAEMDTWSAAVRDGSGAPRYFHLIFIDTIARVPAAAPAETYTLTQVTQDIDLNAATYTLDPRDWFVSASWRETTPGGRSGTLTRANFVLATDDPYDHYKLTVSLAGIAGIDPAARNIELTLTLKTCFELSGVQSGPATIIGCRWRERSFSADAGRLANSTLNTMFHEPGHAMGLAATTLPDGAAVATTYERNGHHCNWNTNQCAMFESNTGATAFCPSCNDACRGRNLASLPQSGDAAY